MFCGYYTPKLGLSTMLQWRKNNEHVRLVMAKNSALYNPRPPPASFIASLSSTSFIFSLPCPDLKTNFGTTSTARSQLVRPRRFLWPLLSLDPDAAKSAPPRKQKFILMMKMRTQPHPFLPLAVVSSSVALRVFPTRMLSPSPVGSVYRRSFV